MRDSFDEKVEEFHHRAASPFSEQTLTIISHVAEALLCMVNCVNTDHARTDTVQISHAPVRRLDYMTCMVMFSYITN